MENKTGYHLRLTTNKEFDEIETFVSSYSQEYIISSEVGHYHCYIVCEYTRKDIRGFVNTKLQLSGNKGFSLADVRNKKQMKKYILKDGYYRFKGIPEEEINKLKLTSFKKGMNRFSEELSLIEEDFLSGPIHNGRQRIVQHMVKVLELRISYAMKPNRNHLESYADYMMMRLDKKELNNYAKHICLKYHQW